MDQPNRADRADRPDRPGRSNWTRADRVATDCGLDFLARWQRYALGLWLGVAGVLLAAALVSLAGVLIVPRSGWHH